MQEQLAWPWPGRGTLNLDGMVEIDQSRRSLLKKAAVAGASVVTGQAVHTRTAVLTFDDAVRSHRQFVAPLLAELGFGATFFVTHRWMDDRKNFMSWEEIAEIADMGFEIGNHSWSHSNFSIPKNAARLEGELVLVENALAKVGLEKPISFAWCGNSFGPEALKRLRSLGYRFARRGLSPELDNRALAPGPAYDPRRHDRLLIPSTGNSVPDGSLDLFRRFLDRAGDGIVVLQFHGVPDVAHPWVHTPPELFRAYMKELNDQGFEVLPMRDLESRIPSGGVRDPNATLRNPEIPEDQLERPVELVQTRADISRWTRTMLRHRYTVSEAGLVAGFVDDERSQYERSLGKPLAPATDPVEVLPYPGGRHPRKGFLEGAIDPLRGTKASVFLPWDPNSYVVVDLPELITSDEGHLFLAHTHVPTIWNDRDMWLDNVDWRPTPGGGLELEWNLPNGIAFGSSLHPKGRSVDLGLWFRNGLDSRLAGLRTQVCIMLKAASGFDMQTRANKRFRASVAAAHSEDKSRWILTAWERSGRCWGNARCPCVHSDPVFADCEPGATARLRGRLWFYEGDAVDNEIASASSRFEALAQPGPQG